MTQGAFSWLRCRKALTKAYPPWSSGGAMLERHPLAVGVEQRDDGRRCLLAASKRRTRTGQGCGKGPHAYSRPSTTSAPGNAQVFRKGARDQTSVNPSLPSE